MDYEITLKAHVDLSNVDPVILQNGNLDVKENLAMVYRFYNPVDLNSGGAPGIYDPGKIYVETKAGTVDGLNGFTPQNGGVGLGSCYVNNNTFNGSYDHIGFHFSTRNHQSVSPFGLLDTIQFEHRSDPGTVNNNDLPVDHNPWMQNFTFNYIAFSVLRPGVGAGRDWFFAPTIESALNIETL